MILIDTHSHLYLEQFDADRDDAVHRAFAAGVRYILLPNIDLQSSGPMLNLAATYPGRLLPMLALHPTSVKEDYKEVFEALEALACQHRFCAIGETGIDLYWDTTYAQQQADAFIRHIHLAHRLGLPLVIHSRNALPQLMEILGDNSLPRVRGVFHCYPGDIGTAHKIIELGFKIGVGGPLTYKNSALADVVKAIGAAHIILETDAPYLPPVPHRGQRNESAYLPLVAHKAAEILNITSEDLAHITTANAIELFALPPIQ